MPLTWPGTVAKCSVQPGVEGREPRDVAAEDTVRCVFRWLELRRGEGEGKLLRLRLDELKLVVDADRFEDGARRATATGAAAAGASALRGKLGGEGDVEIEGRLHELRVGVGVVVCAFLRRHLVCAKKSGSRGCVGRLQ